MICIQTKYNDYSTEIHVYTQVYIWVIKIYRVVSLVSRSVHFTLGGDIILLRYNLL